MWADRESYLSLVGGAFTHITPEVQGYSRISPWVAYVRTYTVIQRPTNRTPRPHQCMSGVYGIA
ncbi:MAG: hypothetical protein KME31_38020 [Tolypothrix carrinoi HA7290-LM1]|nr:hypothetical protein [Tolypothrix carrinoi HA7290-LM1]